MLSNALLFVREKSTVKEAAGNPRSALQPRQDDLHHEQVAKSTVSRSLWFMEGWGALETTSASFLNLLSQCCGTVTIYCVPVPTYRLRI
jgi:hypothetical protein